MRAAIEVQIPSAADLVTAFARSDVNEEAAASRLLAIACELCRAHASQWEAEDESRDAAADSTRLAAVKRRIDAMNVARSDLIDEVDAWAARHLRQTEGAPLHTETLGSVIDRLCIAWVRVQKLHQRGSDLRRALAARQLRELGVAYDTLVAEVVAQRRRIPDWRLLKSYGEGTGARTAGP